MLEKSALALVEALVVGVAVAELVKPLATCAIICCSSATRAAAAASSGGAVPVALIACVLMPRSRGRR